MTTPIPIVFRGGRLAPDPDKPHLKYAAIVHDDLPQPPPAADWLSTVPPGAWGMCANDRYGDCTCAGVAHKRIGDVYVNHNGQVLTVTDTDTLGLYTDITGFNPDDPSTDQGAMCQDVLAYWRKHGFLSEKPVAFAKVNVHDETEVKQAIAAFGQLYCGFEVPGTAMDQFNNGQPWDVVKGSSIEGGHCVTVGAYDEDGLTCVTWGTTQKMTWAFFKEYFDEAWIVIGPDMLDPKTGLDHLGVSLDALESEFTALTGSRIGGR